MSIGLADGRDVAEIAALIEAAYAKYVARLGRRPAPMDADVAASVRQGQVHVLRRAGVVIGTVSLAPSGDALLLDDIAVDPALQGRGHGRALLDHADAVARQLGLSAVSLYTNARMHENIALYRGLGFVETGRREEHGFARVFFRREIGPRSGVGREANSFGSDPSTDGGERA